MNRNKEIFLFLFIIVLLLMNGCDKSSLCDDEIISEKFTNNIREPWIISKNNEIGDS